MLKRWSLLALACRVVSGIVVRDATHSGSEKFARQEPSIGCTLMVGLHDGTKFSDLVGSSGTGTDGVCSLPTALPGDGNMNFWNATRILIVNFHDDTNTCHAAQKALEACVHYVKYVEFDAVVQPASFVDAARALQEVQQEADCTVITGLLNDTTLEDLVGNSGNGLDGVCSLPNPLPKHGITYLQALHILIVRFDADKDACHEAQQALAGCSDHVKYSEFDATIHAVD
mmetsp:Transcript_37436/g.98738  ORF Transcript_37436/g.98738 Transcript_37436/m.98738 type:complete len:229 (-) Transcript_37436:154-840(-)